MLRQIELQGDRRVLCKEILHRGLVPPENLLRNSIIEICCIESRKYDLDSFYDVMKSHMMKRNLFFLRNLVGPHVLSI